MATKKFKPRSAKEDLEAALAKTRVLKEPMTPAEADAAYYADCERAYDTLMRELQRLRDRTAEFPVKVAQQGRHAIEWETEGYIKDLWRMRELSTLEAVMERERQSAGDRYLEALPRMLRSRVEELTDDLMGAPFRHNSTSVMQHVINLAEAEALTELVGNYFSGYRSTLHDLDRARKGYDARVAGGERIDVTQL